MRVKIGDAWHQCQPGQPIMLEFTQQDKELVERMHPQATKLAYFDDANDWSDLERRDWMDDKNTNADDTTSKGEENEQ